MRNGVLIFLIAVFIGIGHTFARSAPPVAEFAFSPTQPTAGEEVTFTAAGSYDRDGNIRFFGWDFGDDGVIEEVGIQVRYVFQTPGQYKVRLVIIDSEGFSASVVKTITVSEPLKNMRDYLPLRPRFGLGNTFLTGINNRTQWEMFSPYGLLSISWIEAGLRIRHADLGLWLDSWLCVRLFSLSAVGIGNTEISLGLALWGILFLQDPFRFLSFSIRQYLGHNFAVSIQFGLSLPMKINNWQAPFGFTRYWMLNLEFLF